MSLLSDAASMTLKQFADTTKGQLPNCDFQIIRALAELAGFTVGSPGSGDLPAAAALVPVTNRQGLTGTIGLEFSAGQAPLTAPTIGPEFHGALTLTLHAPEANANPIYYGFSPDIRPHGDTTDYLGSNLITNGTFTGDDFAGWAVGDWSAQDDKALINFTEGTSNAITDLTFEWTLSREEAITAAAGWYEIKANLGGSITNTGSTLRADIQVNGTAIGGRDISGGDTGVVTVAHYHTGGALLLSIRVHGTREADGGASADVTASVDDVSVKRTVTADAATGTPLLPGQTVDISRKDYPGIDRVYAVSHIGDTESEVIANYSYPA